MRFVTGDEVGLLKVTFKSNILPSKKLKPNKETPRENIKVFGKIDRNAKILNISRFDTKYLVSRSCGSIDVFHPDSGVEKSFSIYNDQQEFVGFFELDGYLISCTKTGNVYITSLETGEQTCEKISAVDCMKPFAERSLFAVGGKEKDLAIFSVDLTSRKVHQVWNAKNVRNDHLDMRVPIWITDIYWKNDKELVTCTAYSHIRTYNTNQKRPTASYTVGTFPLKQILISNDEFVTCDTTGQVTFSKGEQITGSCRGISGQVSCMQIFGEYLVTVGVDRYLRVFELTGKRRMIQSTYLKQRLTSLVIDSDYQELQDDNDWDGLQTVQDEYEQENSATGKKRKFTSGQSKD